MRLAAGRNRRNFPKLDVFRIFKKYLLSKDYKAVETHNGFGFKSLELIDPQILVIVADVITAASLILVLLFGEALLPRRLTVPHIEFTRDIGYSPLKITPNALYVGSPDREKKSVRIRYYWIGVWNRAGRFHKTAEDCEVFLKILTQFGAKHIAYWLTYTDDKVEAQNLFEAKDIRSIMEALRQKVFSQHATDLDPDDGRSVIVAFGVDTLNKVYLATDPPIELPPLKEGRGVVLFQIVMNMKDFPATRSDVYTLTLGDSWDDFKVAYFGKLRSKKFRRSAVKHSLSTKYGMKPGDTN